ncbi:MAG: hypothetical protein VW270_19130, partial [Candidatus Poseidoniales archaeon]
MSKKLLEESTIRQFMKLAKLEPLSDNFLQEKKYKEGEAEVMEEEAALEEMMDVAEAEDDTLEEELGGLFEEDSLEEMGSPMYEEDEDMGMDMEDEAGDMEAEINITPDQARAIIA